MTNPVRMRWLAAVVAVAAIGSAIFLYIYTTDGRIPRGVSISGWNVGGMKVEAFRTEWKRRLAELNKQIVVLKPSAGDDVIRKLPKGNAAPASFTLAGLGLQTNAKEIEQRLAPLGGGSLYERFMAKRVLNGKKIELSLSIDQAVLERQIGAKWGKIQSTKPVDARRVIGAGDQVKYAEGKNAYRIDVSVVKERLEAMLPPLRWAENEAPIALSVDMPVIEVLPQVTVQSLKAQGIERKIVQFSTTVLDGSDGRIHNIYSTAKTVHDLVLKPDEVFDYDKIVRQTNETFGFREAPVILNGKLVLGVGGGICQVSSTLYNAVLRAGLEIVDRRNHSLPVAYVPLGQDATFAQGHINFRFRNNTGAHLLIRTQSTNNQLTVKLFGTMPSNVTYTIRSKTVRAITPDVKYLRNASLKPGETKLLQRGKPGYVVETYRIKREGGRVVSEQLVSRDRYLSTPTIYASNRPDADIKTPSRNNRRSIVEDGVSGPTWLQVGE